MTEINLSFQKSNQKFIYKFKTVFLFGAGVALLLVLYFLLKFKFSNIHRVSTIAHTQTSQNVNQVQPKEVLIYQNNSALDYMSLLLDSISNHQLKALHFKKNNLNILFEFNSFYKLNQFIEKIKNSQFEIKTLMISKIKENYQLHLVIV